MTRRVFTGLACLLACLLFTPISHGQTTYEFIDDFTGLSLLTLDIDLSSPPAGIGTISNLTITDEGSGLLLFFDGPYLGAFETSTGSLIDSNGLLLSSSGEASLVDDAAVPPTILAGIIDNTRFEIAISDSANGIGAGVSAQLRLLQDQVTQGGIITDQPENFSGNFVAVPEPAAATALIGALVTLGCVNRRRS